MNKLKLSAVLVAMATSFTGCATVIDGGTTDMQFTSNVDGVKILMHGGAIGKTPFMGEIPKPDSSVTQFVFEKEGYETETITIGREIVPITILSIISWDLGTTDFLTGSAFKYSRNAVYVEMTPVKTASFDEALYEKRADMRKFILQNYSSVYSQLKAGEGEYFDYLVSNIDTFESKEALQTAFVEKIDEYNMPEFAKFASMQMK
ncbi:MAG TPA: hypothetical protein DHW71_02065 [Gammaproteobacteria bacterium]|nr:hypothetical protein [Gammaproteobacteria bacterium]MEC8009298.1 hypothetical protein [Pseudomonadota bacterium]HCK91739.1 hypothetical protein [Gammaproteobacteria bacterium]|tara:strand:- start:3191 stop:3805 length:615 start_codon:yes stop_codon:yes gene_type:complete